MKSPQNNVHKAKNSRYKSKNKYIKTSEAFKYDIASLPEYRPLKKRVRKKLQDVYIKAEQKERYLSFKFFATFAIVASFALTYVTISAKVLEKKFEIQDLSAQLKEIKEVNSYLETQIAKNLDLDYIEQYASVNLKMQKPASHQIVYIDVPKESYTKVNNSN